MISSSTKIFPKQSLLLMTFECLLRITCVDSNVSYRETHSIQQNVNNKNIVQKIKERKEQTYNLVIYI